MKMLSNSKGIALMITLLLVIVVMILGSVFVLRTINEKFSADRERRLKQSFYIAEGGGQAALSQLDTLINTNLLATVNATNPQTVSTKAAQYVAANDGLGFLIEFCKIGNTPQFTVSGTEGIYNSVATSLGNGAYQFALKVSEKSNPVAVNVDTWDFFYNFRVESTGTVSSVVDKTLFTGDFTVRVQRDNFAKYALFTNHHTDPSGGLVWFTSKTNFSGPLHTNERYSIAFNPSGTFGGAVVQQSSTARFYNNGSPILLNADSNPGKDVATFQSGFTRNASAVSLSSSVDQQSMVNQARANDSTGGNGIFLANNGSSLTGGIYVNGNATVSMGVDGSDNATYTITQGATTKIVTVNRSANQTQVQTVSGGTVTYNGKPDGVDDLGTLIYVNGTVTSFSGTVQKDTEMTMASSSDIVVSNHVRYADYDPAVGQPGDASYQPPNATDKTNLLGLVSWGGNVRVGSSAPNNIDMHGIVMARSGIFTVDSYNNTGVGPRGTATMLGGAITDYYGAFGLYSGSTGQLIAGYGRNFVYDGRTQVGKSPPYFPSLQTFVAFTNDITDKMAWQEGGF